MSADKEPTAAEKREARDSARNIYRSITEGGFGGPRLMSILKQDMEVAGIDFQDLARSRSSNEEIEATLDAKNRVNALQKLPDIYAQLKNGQMGTSTNYGMFSRSSRSNVERVKEYVDFLGGDYALLDTSGARTSADMRSEFEAAAKTAALARAVSDLDLIEARRVSSNLPARAARSALDVATLGLVSDNTIIQSIGRDLQRAGIDADADGNRRYSHQEVATALGREVPPEPETKRGFLLAPSSAPRPQPDGSAEIKR